VVQRAFLPIRTARAGAWEPAGSGLLDVANLLDPLEFERVLVVHALEADLPREDGLVEWEDVGFRCAL